MGIGDCEKAFLKKAFLENIPREQGDSQGYAPRPNCVKRAPPNRGKTSNSRAAQKNVEIHEVSGQSLGGKFRSKTRQQTMGKHAFPEQADSG